MNNKVIEQWLKVNPKLKEISEYTMFVSSEEFFKLTGGEKITVNNKEISVSFLQKIMTIFEYSQFVEKYIFDEIPKFNISYIINGELGPKISYSKLDIILGLNTLLKEKKIILNKDQVAKLLSYEKMVSYEKFIKKYNNTVHSVNMDGRKYHVNVNNILWFLLLPDNEYKNICTEDNIPFINEMPKEYFCYSVVDFLEKNNIFDKYAIPEKIKTRYNELKNSNYIDIQAINKLLEKKESKLDNIPINTSLYRFLLQGLPDNANPIYRMVHLYINMCRYFTYDKNNYITTDNINYTSKYDNPNYVSSLSLSNNKIDEYGFNLLYTKLLNECGINFECPDSIEQSINFRYGKLLINVDLKVNTLKSDLLNIKTGQNIVGLSCINNNKKTKETFDEILNNVYNFITRREIKINNNNEIKVNRIISPYKNKKNNSPLTEKVAKLINKANNSNMSDTNSLIQILNSQDLIFTQEELINNINIAAIRNTELINNGIITTSLIICINSLSFNYPENNIYYIFTPNEKLKPVSKEYIQKNFNEGKFQYIDNYSPRIIGIRDTSYTKIIR